VVGLFELDRKDTSKFEICKQISNFIF